jgi:hypothetical protein
VRWSLQVLRAVQLVSLVAAVLGATAHAHADETHYQNVFIGDRAFGMGGASTGLAADTSGTFYNPGALAELPNRSFSASLGLTAFERTRVLGGVRGPDSVADLRQSASRSLPVFSAALLRFGRHGPDGLKRHAVAFSTLYPASVDLALRVDLLHPMTGIPSTVRVDHTYRQTLYGVSYALHLSHKVAFGITAYLATQRLMHSETLFIASGGVPAPGGGFTDVESYAGLTRIVARSYSLLPRVGFFYRPNAKVSLGITLQPPALTVRTRASLDQQSASSVIDPMTGQTITTFELVEQRGLRVRMPIPWMVRAGIGYHATNSLTLAFDVTLHGAIGARRILPGANEEALARTPFMPVDTRRMATLDAALGAEWVMRDGVTWRVGAFTNRSAAPRIPDTTSQYRLEQVHHYGASFGLGVHVGAYHLTMGLAGSRGRGSALSVDTNPSSTAIYARTRVEERVLYVFITGATRSVARLAQSALHRVQNRNGDGRNDDDDHPDAVEAEEARRRAQRQRRRLRQQQQQQHPDEAR